MKNGIFVHYYKSGIVKKTGHFELGKMDQKWVFYHPNGVKSAIKFYFNGRLYKARYFNKKGERVFRKRAECIPKINWGNNKLEDFIEEQIPKYDSKNKKGTVSVKLHISEEGLIKRILFQDEPDSLLKDITGQIIETIPGFLPGKSGNLPTEFYLNVTLKFNGKPKK